MAAMITLSDDPQGPIGIDLSRLELAEGEIQTLITRGLTELQAVHAELQSAGVRGNEWAFWQMIHTAWGQSGSVLRLLQSLLAQNGNSTQVAEIGRMLKNAEGWPRTVAGITFTAHHPTRELGDSLITWLTRSGSSVEAWFGHYHLAFDELPTQPLRGMSFSRPLIQDPWFVSMLALLDWHIVEADHAVHGITVITESVTLPERVSQGQL